MKLEKIIKGISQWQQSLTVILIKPTKTYYLKKEIRCQCKRCSASPNGKQE